MMPSDETLRRLTAALEAACHHMQRLERTLDKLRPQVPQWATGETCNNCGGGNGQHSRNCHHYNPGF